MINSSKYNTSSKNRMLIVKKSAIVLMINSSKDNTSSIVEGL